MRVLKFLAITLALIGLLGAAGTAWHSRDIAPAHPTLAQADLPPLIPVRDF